MSIKIPLRHLVTDSELEYDLLPYFVGHRNEIERLSDDIANQSANHFLVTGYSGIGRSSFVNMIIARAKEKIASRAKQTNARAIIPLVLVRTPKETTKDRRAILFALVQSIGRTFPFVRNDLGTIRTALMSDTLEKMEKYLSKRDVVASVRIGGSTLSGGWDGSTENTIKSIQTRVEDEAIDDLKTIMDKIVQREGRKSIPWSRRLRANGDLAGAKSPVRLVVVFDEFDSLNLMKETYNLFNAPDVVFIVVGTRRLHDAWQNLGGRDDPALGKFSRKDNYLPCDWKIGTNICHLVVKEESINDSITAKAYDLLRSYLDFNAQGLPREAVEKLKNFQRGNEMDPYLEFTEADLSEMPFFAKLQDDLEKGIEKVLGPSISSVDPAVYDRARRGVYRLVGEMISKRPQFTFSDISSDKALSTMRLLHLALERQDRIVQGLLELLVSKGYLQADGDHFSPGPIVLREVNHIPGYFKFALIGWDVVARSRKETSGGFVPLTIPRQAKSVRNTFRERYTITDEIASGGMGIVYSAHDMINDREIALKILNSGLSRQGLFLERFKREAAVALQLDHPNIVKVFGIEQTDEGNWCIAMELLEGGTLEKLLQQKAGKLNVLPALHIMTQITKALDYAHSHGVVHRDIKPSNILLTPDHRVSKLSDFGIAKASSEGRLTTIGHFLGTPDYASPEQIQAQEVGPLSDLYSLGVVFYEMLTGKVPFRGDEGSSIVASLFQKVYGPLKSPRSIVSSLPVGLERVVLKLLAKNPEERFPSAATLLEELEGIDHSLGQGNDKPIQ